MGDVVKFPGALIDDHTFIVDCARFAEGLLTEKQIKKQYRFDDATWDHLGTDELLVEKIEEEKLRRIRDGSAKRELAQKHVTKAPDVLSGIMLDANASPKHRIDSAKVLDQFAANGPDAAPAGDRFIITINLTADGGNSDTDVLHFDKPLALGPDDSAPQDAVAAITSKKKDGSDGEPA